MGRIGATCDGSVLRKLRHRVKQEKSKPSSAEKETHPMALTTEKGSLMGNDSKPLWAKLAMGYYDDPKFNRVSPLAELLYVRAISYAKMDNTGVLSVRAVMGLCADLGDMNNLSQELLDAELWVHHQDGFYIGNWCEWQEHQDKVERKREAGRASALKRWGSDGSPNGSPNGSAMGNPMQEREIEREKYIHHQNDDEFDLFWQKYPRKVGKEAARRAWKSTAKKRPEIGVVLGALEIACQVWAKGDPRFIPHPSTWLSQGRWGDELTVGVSEGLSERERAEEASERRRRETEERLARRVEVSEPPAEFRELTKRFKRG